MPLAIEGRILGFPLCAQRWKGNQSIYLKLFFNLQSEGFEIGSATNRLRINLSISRPSSAPNSVNLLIFLQLTFHPQRMDLGP